MDTKLTDVDVKNLLAIIAVAPIKGNEATTVALLQQKLTAMLTPTIIANPENNGQTTGTDQPAPTAN